MDKKEREMLRKAWKEEQNETYVLSLEQAELLFTFLEESMEKSSCDHTHRFTEQWLENHFAEHKVEVMEEMRKTGGYCDCEVLMNCYEEYELA